MIVASQSSSITKEDSMMREIWDFCEKPWEDRVHVQVKPYLSDDLGRRKCSRGGGFADGQFRVPHLAVDIAFTGFVHRKGFSRL